MFYNKINWGIFEKCASHLKHIPNMFQTYLKHNLMQGSVSSTHGGRVSFSPPHCVGLAPWGRTPTCVGFLR